MVALLLLSTSVFSQFARVKNGFDRPVWSLYCDSLTNGLIAGGEYKWTTDSLVVNGIARWDGSSWDSVAQNSIQPIGINVAVGTEQFLRFKGNIYAQGLWGSDFEPTFPYSVAKLDTSLNLWTPLPCGIGSPGIRYMSAIGDTLFLTGNFDTLCANPISMIYGFDGNSVFPTTLSNPLPFDPSNTIQKLFRYKGVIYYVGGVYDPGDSSFDMFMQWNGSDWVNVPGITGEMVIKKILVYNNDLYVGGYFFKVDGTPGNCIAKFDGTNWSDLGGGISYDLTNPTCCNPKVTDFTFYHGDLYAVGLFNYAGGVSAQNIAKWDGTDWCGLGSSIDNTINTVGVWNDTLFIGGGFKFIDGDTVNYIAKWLNTGVDTCGHLNLDVNDYITNDFVHIYPNPASELIILELDLKDQSTINLEVENTLGQLLINESIYSVSGPFTFQLNISDLPQGVYILKLQNGNQVTSKKIIKQ